LSTTDIKTAALLGDDVSCTSSGVPGDNSVFEGRSFDFNELLFCECLTR
jgi:hypothetical protein